MEAVTLILTAPGEQSRTCNERSGGINLSSAVGAAKHIARLTTLLERCTASILRYSRWWTHSNMRVSAAKHRDHLAAPKPLAREGWYLVPALSSRRSQNPVAAMCLSVFF